MFQWVFTEGQGSVNPCDEKTFSGSHVQLNSRVGVVTDDP